MATVGCCGQTPKRRDIADELPPNPTVKSGTKMIYFGSGTRQILGKASGLTYHVSNHRRRFMAHANDVDSLLRNRDIMLGS